ncbi:putative ribonuclease H-like domain-containing protein [Tanacetum coccineum]
MDHEDLEQLDEFDLEEIDLKWQVAMISIRMKKFYKKTGRKLQFDAKEPVGFDKTKVECYNCHKTGHFARDCRSKGNQDSRRRDAWNTGNKYKDNRRRSEDEQENYALMAYSSSGSNIEREQLGDASIEIQTDTQALKKVEAQLVAHQQNQLCQMSARDKAGLGYGDQINKGVLSYENEVFGSLFDSRSSDIEDSPVNNRYAEGMHAIPPPMIGIYIPSGPDKEIDDSQFTYGPKQSKPSESDARSSDFTSCESNSSKETHESMPKSVVNEPKVVSQPKVWTDAPIIEEYESDSDDEHVSLPSKEQETPSFANTIKHVKTPRQTLKQQNTCSKSPKPDQKDYSGLMSKKLGLGYGFTKKARFVCGSFRHLIRDCDFHEKRMAKQAEVNKRMCKGIGQRENRPVWNNVNRVNHQNQFVPTAVLTRTGKNQVNTARASSTNNVNTVRASSTKTVSTTRHNFNSQAVPNNAARKVQTVKLIMNNVRPKTVFHKTYSQIRRPFNRTTTSRTKFSNQKVNTAEVKSVSVIGRKWETAIKPSAELSTKSLKNKWIVDSGCFRHMTGNKAYLAEYQDYNGGPVAFGELQHFILFSVSQMCDKKNKVLFTDTECLVLSPDFKLPDENQVLLRVPRQNNMYSFNLKNIVPSGGLACLIAKATVDESNKWHRRFSWVFFLRTKDETSGILKDFIRQIENQLNQKVKTIRCDNGTEFKNRDYIELCWSKGIKREYSNARTPQQNRVAERKNKTLIEAARTMLADSFLPNTFWAEAVSTACYVLNRPMRSENQANKNASPKEANHSAGTQDNIDAGNSKAKSAQDYFINKKPIDQEDQAFLEKIERLKRQEKEDNDAVKALRKEFAQDTKDLLLQVGAVRASSTDTVNTASTPVSTASLSGGLSYTDLTNTDQDDSQIPALEDIYDNPNDGIFTNASYDDEGAVANFTNLETIVNFKQGAK